MTHRNHLQGHSVAQLQGAPFTKLWNPTSASKPVRSSSSALPQTSSFLPPSAKVTLNQSVPKHILVGAWWIDFRGHKATPSNTIPFSCIVLITCRQWSPLDTDLSFMPFSRSPISLLNKKRAGLRCREQASEVEVNTIKCFYRIYFCGHLLLRPSGAGFPLTIDLVDCVIVTVYRSFLLAFPW